MWNLVTLCSVLWGLQGSRGVWRFHGRCKVAESARTGKALMTHRGREGCMHRQAGRQAGRQAARTPGWQGEGVSNMRGHNSQRKIRVTPALT